MPERSQTIEQNEEVKKFERKVWVRIFEPFALVKIHLEQVLVMRALTRNTLNYMFVLVVNHSYTLIVHSCLFSLAERAPRGRSYAWRGGRGDSGTLSALVIAMFILLSFPFCVCVDHGHLNFHAVYTSLPLRCWAHLDTISGPGANLCLATG